MLPFSASTRGPLAACKWLSIHWLSLSNWSVMLLFCRETVTKNPHEVGFRHRAAPCKVPYIDSLRSRLAFCICLGRTSRVPKRDWDF